MLAFTFQTAHASRKLPWAVLFVAIAINPLRSEPPPNSDALLRDGSQALSAGDNARAEKDFRSALREHPDSIEILNNLAIAIARQKREGEAIALYQKALSVNPHDAVTSRNLALAYFRDGQYAKALPMLQTIAAATRSFAALNLTGQAMLALGRGAEAAIYFDHASQLNPSDLSTLDLLAKAYYQSKQYSKVNDVFRRVMAIDSNSAQAHLLLAMAYDKEHQDDKAEQEYLAAAKADPSAMGVHSGLGLLYMRKNKPTEATPEFEKELQNYPSDTVANRYLGELLRQSNRPADAIPHLEAAVKGDPLDKLAWFELGKCEVMIGAPAKAMPALNEAIKLDPNYYQAHFVLGSALASLGRSNEANAERRTAERIQAQERARLQHDISK